MEVKPEYEEFINNFWLFKDRKSVSYHVRESYNKIFNGLGLPLVRGYRRHKVFGYIAHPTNKNVLLPIEKDLQVYFRGMFMFETKEYFVKDIIAWINSCNPNIPMTHDIWKENIQQGKHLFPEILKPLSYRISIVTNGTPQAAPKAQDEAGSLQEGQTAGRATEEEESRTVPQNPRRESKKAQRPRERKKA